MRHLSSHGESGLHGAGTAATSSALGFASIFCITIYIAAQLVSNIASNKIGVVFGLSVDMGTFLYPLTFTLRDLVHKSVGKKGAQALVVSTGVANLFMVAYLWWTTFIPSDASWGLGKEYAAILSPIGRIVIASVCAQIIAELIDTEVFHRIRERTSRGGSRRFQWVAVLGSNAVSIPIDNLIFVTVAFLVSLPLATIAQIFLLNLLVKFGMTLFSLPLIYLVPERRRTPGPAETASATAPRRNP